MQQTHSISAPDRQGPYPDRELDCAIALRPAFAELAEHRKESIAAAIGGEFSDELIELIWQAKAAGWSEEDAKAAIVQLAREYEGAQGAVFD